MINNTIYLIINILYRKPSTVICFLPFSGNYMIVYYAFFDK